MNLTFDAFDLPFRLRPETTMTDEELERFSSDNKPLRIEREPNGELIVMLPNSTEGSLVDSEVSLELAAWTRIDGRGRCFSPNAGFMLPDTSVRAADAAWISWERWNGLPPERRKVFAQTCPEFVIEVQSTFDRLRPLQKKMQQWVTNGAMVGWLIDPERRVVEIYHQGEEAEVLYEPTSVRGDGPVRGFELVMQRIWG